jgi:hypothetical protein
LKSAKPTPRPVADIDRDKAHDFKGLMGHDFEFEQYFKIADQAITRTRYKSK